MQPHYSQSCCSGKLINTFNWGCSLLIYFTACGSEINTNRWKRPQQHSCCYPQTSSCLFLEEEKNTHSWLFHTYKSEKEDCKRLTWGYFFLCKKKRKPSMYLEERVAATYTALCFRSPNQHVQKCMMGKTFLFAAAAECQHTIQPWQHPSIASNAQPFKKNRVAALVH